MTPITLSDLAYTLEAVVDGAFGQKAVWVVAETSDIKNYPDRNYCFLTLVERGDGPMGRKDTTAKLEAAIWRKNYGIIREFETATGVAFARNIQVLLLVTVGFHAVYGLRLEVVRIDHSYTLGNMERDRQAILDGLLRDHPGLIWQQDGHYITANQLLPRPSVWQRIALITAPNSDGWRDFRHELTNNAWAYQFQIDEYFTQIQGQGAERAICAQLAAIDSSQVPYDAVVIVRGGGSQLDFGSFDTYMLGLAVAGFRLPVLAGIGHERNVSITDLLCHESVKTPTKAANFLIDHNRQFEESCLHLRDRLIVAARENLLAARENLDRETERMRYVGHTYLKSRHTELAEMAVTVRHLDPVNVLKRGYALVLKNGRIQTRADNLLAGDTVQVQFASQLINVLVAK